MRQNLDLCLFKKFKNQKKKKKKAITEKQLRNLIPAVQSQWKCQ